MNFRNKDYKTNLIIEPVYKIELHKQDLKVLLNIQRFFGGIGEIHHLEEKDHVVYSVTSIKDLHNVIIPHFNKYPFLTEKISDFLLFKDIVEVIVNKIDMNTEELKEITIKLAPIHRGEFLEPISSFKNLLVNMTNQYVPVLESRCNPLTIKDLNLEWLKGFTDAKGCLHINPLDSNKTVFLTEFSFRLTPHPRDILLFHMIKEFLGGGYVIEENTKVVYRTDNFNFIYEKIIPIFSNNALQSNKNTDSLNFFRSYKIIKNKFHLSEKDLEKINKKKFVDKLTNIAIKTFIIFTVGYTFI